MKSLLSFLAAAAVSVFAASAIPTSASPLASGLTNGNATVPYTDQGSVQNVGGYDYDYGYYDEYPDGGYHGGPNVTIVIPAPGYVDDYYDHGYGYGHNHHKWRHHHRHRHHKWRRHRHGHHKWRGY